MARRGAPETRQNFPAPHQRMQIVDPVHGVHWQEALAGDLAKIEMHRHHTQESTLAGQL